METTKFFKPDFLDILFNDRNKDYGAYDLRRRYDKRVRNAVIGMGCIVLLIIGGYSLSTRLKAGEVTDRPRIEVKPIAPIDVELEKPPVTPPPPARVEPPAASLPMVKHPTFVVTEDDNVRPEDEVPKNDQLQDVSIGLKNAEGVADGVDNGAPVGPTGSGVVEAPKAEPKNEGPQVFVEIMPEFPGGEKALAAFLNRNIRYPAAASEIGVEGTVFVKFVVGADGEISNVELVGAKKGAGLDEEALRVVRKMPDWKPGRQNGRNVAVYFNLPIRFVLEGE
ncbi:energy transducer TonB [Chitinophaga sp. GCM10012297]|uniref:Energy transducer TonB n=1 Tax=Chitinophaga chungangae TaxID=2821488 RepID=A0ABS3YJF4_9BACT|nr:energy transducer TonB [Chitinophaga chungangae]MBO9154831.1 energy transducer TonB [Chitinophaga chungangae]